MRGDNDRRRSKLPHVDTYLLDLLDGHVFRKADFHEIDDGHCRLLPPLTHRLAETLPRWQDAVAPYAENVAHTLADASPRSIKKPTPLTSATRRTNATQASNPRRRQPATRQSSTASNRKAADIAPGCEDCGRSLARKDRRYCAACWPTRRTKALQAATAAASAALADPHERTKRGAAVVKGRSDAIDQAAIAHGWQPGDWQQQLAPEISTLTLAQIQRATGLAVSQASRIKRGVHTPHPRHWAALRTALAEGRNPTGSRPVHG